MSDERVWSAGHVGGWHRMSAPAFLEGCVVPRVGHLQATPRPSAPTGACLRRRRRTLSRLCATGFEMQNRTILPGRSRLRFALVFFILVVCLFRLWSRCCVGAEEPSLGRVGAGYVRFMRVVACEASETSASSGGNDI